MGINLEKGQKISLQKADGSSLQQIFLGVGWDVAKSKGFFGFGGGVDFGEELGRVGLEVVGAAVAAEEDDAVGLAGDAVDVRGGVAHAAEGFIGYEAGLERVGGAGLGDGFGIKRIERGCEASPDRRGTCGGELLAADDVLVHPGYFFDFPREAYVVVSLLPEPAVFERAISRVLRRASAGGAE